MRHRLLLTLLVAVPCGAAALPASGDMLMSRGDSAVSVLRYDDAVSLFQESLRRTPDNPAVYWRLARVHVAMGEMETGDAKERTFRSAEAFARNAIRCDSTMAAGHTWLAAALGNIAMFEGARTKVKLCSEIKRELDRAIALDSTDDVAFSILGSFYRALGNISWLERRLANIFLGTLPDGGYEEAERALQRAIALHPDVLRHREELGMLYVDWGRKQDAKKALEMSLQVPTLLASDIPAKERIRKVLATLE